MQNLVFNNMPDRNRVLKADQSQLSSDHLSVHISSFAAGYSVDNRDITVAMVVAIKSRHGMHALAICIQCLYVLGTF